MSSWLQHPGFQSAVAPLLVSIVLAGLLARPRLAGLAPIGGVLVCIHLAIGLELIPLTATRRIVVATIAAAILGVIVDRLPRGGRRVHAAAAVLGAAAALWVTAPALSNLDTGAALATGALVAVAAAALALGFDRLAARPVRAGSAALGSGLGVGAVCVISASASLGQIGIALGAGAGGLLLVQMMRGAGLAAGRALTAPASALAASLGAGAVVLAEAPWGVLPVLAAVPFACTVPKIDRRPVWLQALVHGAAGVAVGALAAIVAWQGAAGPSSVY